MQLQLMKSVDYALVVRELSEAYGARLDNVYDSLSAVRLKLRKQGNEYNVVCEPGVRLHFSWSFAPSQQSPSSFVMLLRKELDNAVFEKAEQLNFDRIVVLTFAAKGGVRKLVFEQFGKGNAFLLDEAGLIIRQMRSIELGGRKLHAGLPYSPPEQGEGARKVADQVTQVLELKAAPSVFLEGGVPKGFGFVKVDGESTVFESYCQALDFYYREFSQAKLTVKGEEEGAVLRKQVEKLKKSLEEQRKRLVELDLEEAQAKRAGELVFENFEKVEEALAKAKGQKEKKVVLEL